MMGGASLCLTSDLALRCLLETPGRSSETEPAPKRLKTSEPADPAVIPELGPGPGPVLGLAVALCCHHRCVWRHYVGQQFFRQRGLGAAEFSAFCRMSSWATCGLRPTSAGQAMTNQSADHDEGHDAAEETEAVSR